MNKPLIFILQFEVAALVILIMLAAHAGKNLNNRLTVLELQQGYIDSRLMQIIEKEDNANPGN